MIELRKFEQDIQMDNQSRGDLYGVSKDMSNEIFSRADKVRDQFQGMLLRVKAESEILTNEDFYTCTRIAEWLVPNRFQKLITG